MGLNHIQLILFKPVETGLILAAHGLIHRCKNHNNSVTKRQTPGLCLQIFPGFRKLHAFQPRAGTRPCPYRWIHLITDLTQDHGFPIPVSTGLKFDNLWFEPQV